MSTSFGQVIPPLGPGIGFPGAVSRFGDRVIAARPVLSTTASALSFGQSAVLIPDSTGGTYQSVADFIAASAANVALLPAQFAGVAVRNVKTQLPYPSLQSNLVNYVTTGTATINTTALTVASATNLKVGMFVAGAGIQQNTTVTAISGTAITLSLAVTAALSTTPVSFVSPLALTTGSYAAGTIAEVLERGNITVAMPNGTPQAGNPVYIRTAVNAALPNTAVGDFEALADTPVVGLMDGTTTTLTPDSMTGLVVGMTLTTALPGYLAPNTVITAVGVSTITINVAPLQAMVDVSVSATGTLLLEPGTYNPLITFRTGFLDFNGMAEITIKRRNAS